MMTDPLADLFTRIRNAGMARLDRIEVPYSKVKKVVAGILKKEGYVSDFRVAEGGGVRPTLTIFLKYANNKTHVIDGIRRVSRPGQRIYAPAAKIPKVLGGLGIAVLSTSQGVMSDREARKKNVGGEILCEVW
jgi:small subunit ribosomal protein S8